MVRNIGKNKLTTHCISWLIFNGTKVIEIVFSQSWMKYEIITEKWKFGIHYQKVQQTFTSDQESTRLSHKFYDALVNKSSTNGCENHIKYVNYERKQWSVNEKLLGIFWILLFILYLNNPLGLLVSFKYLF